MMRFKKMMRLRFKYEGRVTTMDIKESVSRFGLEI